MKQLRIISLSLLALFALGAALASTAAAEEKEGFLPLNMRHFQVLGTNPILESSGGGKIVCLKASGTGEFDKESDTHGKGLLHFAECDAEGFPAYSLGDKETNTLKEAVILAPVLFLICLIDSAALLFGIFVELTSPVHIHIKTLGALIEVKGSAIGHILPAAEPKHKLTLWAVDFTQEKGKPSVKDCKDENNGVKLAQLLSATHPKAAVEAAEQIEKGLIQFLEAQELMDKK